MSLHIMPLISKIKINSIAMKHLGVFALKKNKKKQTTNNRMQIILLCNYYNVYHAQYVKSEY